ncbi:hypothetical protein FB451DRAFT_1217130 [Mycena latifolia]|nr:hypothetical protein FB451DRAFT_1217130 [Mycena latifolia]
MASQGPYSVVIHIFVLLLALASISVGRETGAPNPATPVICQGQAMSCTNQTLFTPANSGLPEGTYIATSLPGARELADYLDTHSNTTVAHLLISDASIDDLATDFGYDYNFIAWGPEYDSALAREQRNYTQALNRNISQTLIQTILDLDAVSARIMDQVAPSLESLSYLNYIRLWDESYYDRQRDVPNNRTRTVLDRDFPRLTHLTLRDHHWRFQDLAGRRTFFRALPALTHLHVVSDFFPPLSTVRASVPNATHIRLSGNLPAEFSARRMFLVQWARSLVNVLRRRYVPNSPLIIVQPPFTPMLNRGMKCGSPGIAYTCLLGRLARNRDIHLSLPVQYDYDEYGASYDASRTFSLRRGIAEFADRLVGGGEGEWAVPSRNDTLRYAKMTLNFCA